LRKMEKYCRDNPKDAPASFVLAYHYLTLGSKDPAIHALEAAVKNQPKDITAKRMLDALRPAEPATPKPPPKSPEGDAPDTDLVGDWKATAGPTTIELAITEDS